MSGLSEASSRIAELPEGGGAAGGKDVWFVVSTEDGRRQEFRLHVHQLEAFIMGLRRFGHSAETLLAQRSPGAATFLNQYWPSASAIDVERTVDGEVCLVFRNNDGVPINVKVPKEKIKPLLLGLVKALTER